MSQPIAVKPDDARNFECCAMPKKCEGDNCMAWTWQLRDVINPLSKPRFPLPLSTEHTGFGYCGRAA